MFAASHRPSGPGAVRRNGWHALVATALLTTFVAAHAQPPPERLAQVSLDDLKRSYLGCHRASMRRALDSGEAMHCSVIYEALKHRAFGGDFERVLAWTREQDAHAAKAGNQPGPPHAASCALGDL